MPEKNQSFRQNKKLFNWRNKTKLTNSKKHKKVCSVLSYIDHSLIVISTITKCVSIFVFASLVGILLGIASFIIGLKMFCNNCRNKKV